MRGRISKRRISDSLLSVAILSGVCASGAATASELPAELARIEEPDEIRKNSGLEPWGKTLEAPTAEGLDGGGPESGVLAPIPMEPVQDRLVGKLVHWVMLHDPALEQPFEELAAFIGANRNWPGSTALRIKAERAIDASTPTQAILRLFDAHRPLTLEGSVAWSRALLRSGEDSRAVENIRRTWIHFDLDRVEERNYVAEFGEHLRTEDHIARLDRLLWDNRRTAASRHLDRLGEGRRALADARVRLMAERGGVDAAVERVPSWLENDPGLVYERVRWRRRKDMTDSAAELLLGYNGDMVRPDRWWTERQILARRLLRDGDPAMAYRLVQGHGLTDPADRAEAEFLAGWIALRFLDKPQAAFGHFAALYDFVSYSISRARGAYWTGRAAEAAGEEDIARQWYRAAAEHGTTFYGQLAADRLGIDLPPPAGHEAKIDPAEAEAFERDDLVRLARLMIGLKATRPEQSDFAEDVDPAISPVAFLAGLDEEEALIPFLRHIAWRGRTTTEWVKAAQLARDAGRTEIAVYVGRRAAREGVLLRDLGYPTMVVEGKLPLDPALLHALVRQESAFDPGAHSRAGARGLMQLMPATAKRVARDLAIKGHSTRRLTDDPYFNLTLGSAYLDSMLSRYRGSMVMALAAYNAGPHRVDRWLEEYGDPRRSLDDVIDWIESIPFSETRNYVQRILETLPIYRWKLEDAHVVLLRPDDLTLGLPGYELSEQAE